MDINDPVHKESILFGGTTVLVTTTSDDNDETMTSTLNSAKINASPPPPDHGIIGMVLRTGFDTTQGNLFKRIINMMVLVAGKSDKESTWNVNGKGM